LLALHVELSALCIDRNGGVRGQYDCKSRFVVVELVYEIREDLFVVVGLEELG
jgi:hypothetical protein